MAQAAGAGALHRLRQPIPHGLFLCIKIDPHTDDRLVFQPKLVGIALLPDLRQGRFGVLVDFELQQINVRRRLHNGVHAAVGGMYLALHEQAEVAEMQVDEGVVEVLAFVVGQVAGQVFEQGVDDFDDARQVVFPGGLLHQLHIHRAQPFRPALYFECHPVIFPQGTGEVVDMDKNAVLRLGIDDKTVAFFFVKELDPALPLRFFRGGISRGYAKDNVLRFDYFSFRRIGRRGTEVAVFVDIRDHILEGFGAGSGSFSLTLFAALLLFLVLFSAIFFFFFFVKRILCFGHVPNLVKKSRLNADNARI